MKARAVIRAIIALWRAQREWGRRPRFRQRKLKARERRRRRALMKLGGGCACCGLGMEFAAALTIHHKNANGAEHRRVLGGLSIGLAQWVLVTPEPGAGLFAVEVLCEVCHKMEHAQGKCPHRKGGKKKTA